MKSCYEFVKAYKKKYPMTVSWRLKSHCKVIDKHLNKGEKILYAFAAQKSESTFSLINTNVFAFTNKRIIVATKRLLFGYFFKSITPDMYNDLTVHRGLIWGSIVLDTIKEVITITNIDKNALDEIETNVTEVMIKHKKEYGIIRESKSTKKK